MSLPSDITASLIAASLYIALFAAMEIWSRVGSPDVEMTRKGVHFGGGLIALSFPYLFDSHWTVLILAILFTIALIVTKRLRLLRSVQGVDRITIGEIIYPLAVYATFFLSTTTGAYYIYTIAILELALADAVAGIVGKRFGRRIYRIGGGRKSVEGSAAFFTTAFAIVFAGLLFAGTHTPVECSVAAAFVALPLTALEAVAPTGTDNVAVPIGAWYLVSFVAQ